jgi:hypothetical protein
MPTDMDAPSPALAFVVGMGTVIALGAIAWLWSPKWIYISAVGLGTLSLMIVWAIVAIHSVLSPTYFGHDISYIFDFLVYVGLRGAILGSIAVGALFSFSKRPFFGILLVLLALSAGPPILLWWSPRALRDALEGSAPSVSLAGSVALIEAASYALLRSLFTPVEPPPPPLPSPEQAKPPNGNR